MHLPEEDNDSSRVVVFRVDRTRVVFSAHVPQQLTSLPLFTTEGISADVSLKANRDRLTHRKVGRRDGCSCMEEVFIIKS